MIGVFLCLWACLGLGFLIGAYWAAAPRGGE